jgi:hypothetical protein
VKLRIKYINILKCFQGVNFGHSTIKGGQSWCCIATQYPRAFRAGLPDGLLPNKKYQFGYDLEGLGMENVLYFK